MSFPSTSGLAFVSLFTRTATRHGVRQVSYHHSSLPFRRALGQRAYFQPRMVATVSNSTQPPDSTAQSSTSSDDRGMFTTATTFTDLGVSPKINAALAEQGITTPTKAQAAVIPIVLEGLSLQSDYAAAVKDADSLEEVPSSGSDTLPTRPPPPANDVNDVLMVGAETGSGKTLAYLLPFVEAAKVSPVELKGVILVPSRELCWQVSHFLTSYFPNAPKSLILAGGSPPDVSDIHGVQIVIATPTALLNYFRFNKKADTSDKYIVIDEADMLLSGSFLRDVEEILNQPGMKPFATRKNGDLRAANRNRLLFIGATYPHWTGDRVKSIITWMKRRYPTVRAVQTDEMHKRSSRLRSNWQYLPDREERLKALLKILNEEASAEDKIMVFASKASSANQTCEDVVGMMGSPLIEKFGKPLELHKNVLATERVENVQKFRRGDSRLIFCTDLGARGLDLGNVTRVIEFDFATNVVGYLHRIGRTARAGAAGKTCHFYDEQSRPLAETIREKAEGETAMVDGVFSRKRSFRRKLKKKIREEKELGERGSASLDDVEIDQVDAEEEARLRG